MTLDLSADVTGFFEKALIRAVEARGYEPTPATRQYLVALLSDFTRPRGLAEEALDRPVTLLLKEALELAGPERFERLRSLGDTVLYTSGFFADHFEIRGVELSYVASVGARAYDQAGSMLRTRAEASGSDVFTELAADFEELAAVLRHVSDAMAAQSATTDRAVLRVYERWLRNGSAGLAAGLAAAGVVPVKNRGMIH